MRAIKTLVALALTLLFLATGYIYQENQCIAMYNDNLSYPEGSAPG